MKPGTLAVLVVCWLLAALEPAARALDLLPRSTSRSKQFVIYAQSGAVRGGVGVLAEETKTGMLEAMGLKDEWRVPIVIDLRYPDAGLPGAQPPAALSLSQTGAGLKIELHLLLGEAGRGNRLRDEIVRALLLELAYRDYRTLGAGQSFNYPPAWLVEGFSAFLENQESGVQASLFAALLPAGQALSIRDFLSKNPATMDSISHTVYRAYSFNLVRLLLQELPDGKAGMASYIRALPGAAMDSDKDAGALKEHFPDLAASPDSLDKWWAVSLGRLSASDEFQAYSVEESERKLVDLLSFAGPSQAAKGETPKTYTLADYKEFTPLKHNKEILETARRGLMELSGRANPLYRPIVVGYQEIIALLVRNKTPGKIGERLKELEAQRVEMLKRKGQIDDYMNWYEATQLTTTSGAFEEYFRAAKQLEDGKGQAHRPDAISTYMDGLDMEFK